jgi:hypothetical protein
MAPFSVTVHHGPYLHLVGSGDAKLSDLRGLVDLAARIAADVGSRRVLADLISINVLFSDEDFRKLQIYAVETLADLERLAYTVPACYNKDKSDPPVQRQGLTARAFTALHAACDWVAN